MYVLGIRDRDTLRAAAQHLARQRVITYEPVGNVSLVALNPQWKHSSQLRSFAAAIGRTDPKLMRFAKSLN
jgi:hypothetical protein